MASAEKIGRGTFVEEVTDRLRSMLLSGEIEAGERLRMKDLEGRFGVSHIPIREALRTLEGEGLVESQPQRGAVATGVSLELLDEVYHARRLLEPGIAAQAVTKFTPDTLASLEAAAERMVEAERSPQADAFFKAHHEFHLAVLQPALTPILERVLKQLWGMSERFIRLSVREFDSAVVVLAHEQHVAILEACRAADPRVSVRLTEHLHVTEDHVRQWAVDHPPPGVE